MTDLIFLALGLGCFILLGRNTPPSRSAGSPGPEAFLTIRSPN